MLFNFEGTSKAQKEIKFIEKEQSRDRGKKALKWGCSSVGRAPALQAGGHGFESHHLHQPTTSAGKVEAAKSGPEFSTTMGKQEGKQETVRQCKG